jgi:hypothetical protein
MMALPSIRRTFRNSYSGQRPKSFAVFAAALLIVFSYLPVASRAQASSTPPAAQTPDTGGPDVDNGPIIIRK